MAFFFGLLCSIALGAGLARFLMPVAFRWLDSGRYWQKLLVAYVSVAAFLLFIMILPTYLGTTVFGGEWQGVSWRPPSPDGPSLGVGFRFAHYGGLAGAGVVVAHDILLLFLEGLNRRG